MPASEARIAAPRANGLKSRGPITAEGKAISRRNALKHGMAGSGVVVPVADSAEIERRSLAMQAEMAPRTEMGKFLVNRLAELTVRVERCSRHERAVTEHRVRHAEAAFDEARLAEVDATISLLAREPATLTRRLRSMPEGVDRMIAHLLELREELNTGRWDWHHGEKLANLTGRRWMDLPVSRVKALSEAINGNFGHLLPGDGDGLSDRERVDWARNAMADLIDEEMEMLLSYRATLDLEAIQADRAGAADRALFDPSREATLARRYEAAAERGVYRALRELKEVQAEASRPVDEPVEESLGSFGAEDSDPASEDPESDDPPARRVVPATPPDRTGGPVRPERIRAQGSTRSAPASTARGAAGAGVVGA